MDDEPWVRHWFGDDDLDAAIETANASAQRLADTVYWGRAHDAVNQLLDDIVGR